MIRLGYHRFLPLLLAVLPTVAAPRGKTDRHAFRPAAVSSAAKSEMSRYSLSAFENCDATNALETNVAFVGGVSSPEYVTFALKDKTLSMIDCSRGGILKWTASKVNGIVDSSCEMNETGPHTVYTISSKCQFASRITEVDTLQISSVTFNL